MGEKKRAGTKAESLVPGEIIQSKIFLIRGRKIMLDRDLDEFMFQLTQKEYNNLRSQFATSSWGGRRYLPYVFTDYGVAMLSSILNSDRAIQVNIQIMRTFVKIREMLQSNDELRRKFEALERRFDRQNEETEQKFRIVFDAIKKLLEPPPPTPRKRIGF